MDVREHNDKAALDRVNALLASEPHDPGALTLKGDVEAASGKPADAQAAYVAAQQQQPSATVAVKEFQVALAAHDSQPEKPLLDWLAKQPNDARVRDVLGNYYLGKHDLRGAARAFEAVVRLAPGNVVALNNLAWVDDRLGDAHAEALAQRAHALAPQSANVDDTLGWILARKGDEAARAVPLLAQAVKLAPRDPEIRYHYAYALVQDGQRAEAREILSKLLADHASFDSHSDAERLLAATRT
jgi:predicted Zn-dependent protease